MITPDLDKIKSTLVKVKKLAEEGSEGEKQAAQSKLSTLLEKYGVDLSELDEHVIQERDIKYNKDPDSRDIMVQIILSVAETRIWVSSKKYLAHAMLTSQQYIEVVEKYKYYWNLYKKQREYFKRAFVTKNKLYSTTTANTADVEISDNEKKEIAFLQVAIQEGNFDMNNPKGFLTEGENE
jgi:hypothetical protein